MAKNASDFVNDLQQDADLREAMNKVITKDSTHDDIIAFAAAQGYEFSEQDMNDLKDNLPSEISDEDLDKVSGGNIGDDILYYGACVSFFFIACW